MKLGLNDRDWPVRDGGGAPAPNAYSRPLLPVANGGFKDAYVGGPLADPRGVLELIRAGG